MVIIPWVSKPEELPFRCAYCRVPTRQSPVFVLVRDGKDPNAKDSRIIVLDHPDEPYPPDVREWLYPSCCLPCVEADRWTVLPSEQATDEQRKAAREASVASVRSAMLQASVDTIFRVRGIGRYRKPA